MRVILPAAYCALYPMVRSKLSSWFPLLAVCFLAQVQLSACVTFASFFVLCASLCFGALHHVEGCGAVQPGSGRAGFGWMGAWLVAWFGCLVALLPISYTSKTCD